MLRRPPRATRTYTLFPDSTPSDLCGPEKLARIREMGLSCVEIDLRRRSRRATREEVEQAMLSDAHRYWLNNPKLDRAATRLDQQIEREREEVAKAAEAARIEKDRKSTRLNSSH